MRKKLFQRVASRCHRDSARTDRFSAGDVVRRIADDEHVGRGKFAAMVRVGSAQRVRPELISILGVVCKCSKRKRSPEVEMAEFDLCSALEIAREQTLCEVGTAADVADDFGDTGQHSGAWVLHFFGEPPQVTIEETSDVCGRSAPEMMLQDIAGDPDVGASEVLEPAKIVVETELASEREYEAAFTGAAGVDQSTVDVPKQECIHVKTASSGFDRRLASPSFPNRLTL